MTVHHNPKDLRGAMRMHIAFAYMMAASAAVLVSYGYYIVTGFAFGLWYANARDALKLAKRVDAGAPPPNP